MSRKISQSEAAEAINRCATTDDGQILLAVLQIDCGFMANLMSLDDPNVTQVLASKRGVYAGLRKYINPEFLIEIEYRIQIVKDKIKKAEK